MADPDPQTPSPSRPPEEPRRRTAAPLLWIVLLLALLAFGWFVYNDARHVPAPDSAPPALGHRDGKTPPAERERAADDAAAPPRGARRRTARATPPPRPLGPA